MATQKPDSYQPACIVLIEDNVLLAELLLTILHMEGYQMAQVPEGRQGLHVVQETRPAAVISNVDLPVVTECRWSVRSKLHPTSPHPRGAPECGRGEGAAPESFSRLPPA